MDSKINMIALFGYGSSDKQKPTLRRNPHELIHLSVVFEVSDGA
jgi:hypothetical protein